MQVRENSSSALRVLITASLAAFTIGCCFPARAAVFTEALNFSVAGQSIWGSGGGTGFYYGAHATTTILIFDLDFGYSIGASSGTVSAAFPGRLFAEYAPSLSQPGMTSLNLSFLGNSNAGNLTSNLGYIAQLCAGVCVGPDLYLDINKSYTPHLPVDVSSTTSKANVVKLPIINVLAGDAGAGLGVTQKDQFDANGLNGTLYYSLEGSGDVKQVPFSLTTNAGTSLDVDLGEVGTWDFWFVDQTLVNTFSTSLNLDVGVYAETAAGCGGFPYLDPCVASTTLVSPNVYSGDPFALAFNSIDLNRGLGFSIQVNALTVPEPATLALLGVALAGLGFSRRRKLH